jgi:hypothetical protein
MSVTCPCQNCNMQLEFDAEDAGKSGACPHCGMDTLLFIPPPIQAEFKAKATPVASARTMVKCSCQRCGGNLEFDSQDAGESTSCPHCHKETTLYVPQAIAYAAAPHSPAIQDSPAIPDSTFRTYLIISALIPLVGVAIGIWMLSKNDQRGNRCLVMSVVSIVICIIFISAM